MKLAVLASIIMVICIADICHAVDPELTAKLGIPVLPQSSGATFQGFNGLNTMGLGGCGNMGMNTSLTNLTNLASQSVSSVQNLASIATTAMFAYFMPTEYSTVSNLMSMAQKNLALLTNKCNTYQAARGHMESKDTEGMRKAAYAKCMEQTMGDDITCSKPPNAWPYLYGNQGCVSIVDKSLTGVTLPQNTNNATMKAFFGDFQVCADSSGGTPPMLTADLVYQANMRFYGPAVNNAVSAAQTRYLTQADIQTMNLCVGPGSGSNGGGSPGVTCPHAETINMVATFPADEQAVFAAKLAEHLSLLQTVYNTYSWSSVMNNAAYTAQTPVPDAFTSPIAQMTSQKEKEVNNLVRLKSQANGNDGSLSSWESQVMERNGYWTKSGTSQQNETDAGNSLFGSGTVSGIGSNQNNIQTLINTIVTSYSNP
jgi:hypothetical protein